MKERCSFILRTYVFWLALFFLFRLMFVTYNFRSLEGASSAIFAELFMRGSYMDTSGAAWITFFSLILLPFSWLSAKYMKLTSRLIAFSFIVVTSLIAVSDMQLFRSWGSRMDSLVLDYIASPNEAFAASSASPIFLLLIIMTVIVALSIFAYLKLVEKPLVASPAYRRREIFLVPFVAAIFAVVGRGGIQPIPLNNSFAYFSNHDFCNQAAINVSQNFFESIYRDYFKDGEAYYYVDVNTASEALDSIYSGRASSNFPRYLNTHRPNIVLIIWESLAADVVKALGGHEGVTPGFEELINEGVFFSRIYASGDRTNNGLTALYSGYPAQPRGAIIKNNRKIAALPSLSHSLRQEGYRTSFYYGGDIEFDNMKAFLLRSGVDKLVGSDDFPDHQPKSQWGAHDHDVFARALADLKTEESPFFATVLTLSSHEPFDVPFESHFDGVNNQSKFKNSLLYTDQTVYKFVQALKTMPWYDDTLIIITSDHGTSILEGHHRFAPRKNHVPLLFLGGALNVAGVLIDKVGSQQDLATTILKQMLLDASTFRFSDDLLSPDKKSFAQFFFNDGFTYINDHGYLAFNNAANSIIHQDSQLSEDDLITAKSIMQNTFNDFLAR